MHRSQEIFSLAAIGVTNPPQMNHRVPHPRDAFVFVARVGSVQIDVFSCFQKLDIFVSFQPSTGVSDPPSEKPLTCRLAVSRATLTSCLNISIAHTAIPLEPARRGDKDFASRSTTSRM